MELVNIIDLIFAIFIVTLGAGAIMSSDGSSDSMSSLFIVILIVGVFYGILRLIVGAL